VKVFFALFATLLATAIPALADVATPAGRAKFEIFGMLDEYGGRYMDGSRVEGFYPSESALAEHFESLLPAFCAEEGIDGAFEKRVDDGHTIFYSSAIAAAINRQYSNNGLKGSFFDGASTDDKLRYLKGTYLRYGYNKNIAAFCMADAPAKLHTVGVLLARLGCTHVELYSTGDTMVPTSLVLLFTPSPVVKESLGIEKVVTVSDLKEFRDTLTLDQKIDATQSL
jgi:hypothetical protein